ncbi:hypothetical protein C8F01DRAFT_1079918 [Mycena amicta]|nr:hypothetical protein C8F01DRAFT_1079918 [Mycena amicta]
MPRGRPPLDPATRQQRREETHARYNDKSDKKRAAIAASDVKTQADYRAQAREASERYRYRKAARERKELRAAQATSNQARNLEQDILRAKHKPLQPPPHPAQSLPRTTKAMIPSTPAPSRSLSSIAYDLSDAEDDEDDNGQQHSDGSIWLGRTLHAQRCPHCYDEGCVGCRFSALLGTCDFRALAICKRVWLGLLPHAPMPVLLCRPIYALDLRETRENHPGPFYAVICQDFRGVVGTRDSLRAILKTYPEAQTWIAPDWTTFDRRWTLDCTEYHYHDDDEPDIEPERSSLSSLELPSSLSSMSSPPWSLSSLHPTPPPSRPATPVPKRVGRSDSPPPPPPVPTAPLSGSNTLLRERQKQRARDEEMARIFSEEWACTHLPPAPPARTPSPLWESTTSGGSGAPSSPRKIYAVTGGNRLFKRKSRALAAWRAASDDADLLVTHAEDEALDFLDGR